MSNITNLLQKHAATIIAGTPPTHDPKSLKRIEENRNEREIIYVDYLTVWIIDIYALIQAIRPFL